MPPWEVVPEQTKEHWLELRDPEGWWEAFVKWDGCGEVYQALNVPFTIEARANRHGSAIVQSFHFCNVDDLIARLYALKAEALKHFSDWPQ